MQEVVSSPNGQTYTMTNIPGTTTGTYQIQAFYYYAEWFPDQNVPMSVCNIDLDVQQFHGAGTSHWVAGCIGQDPLGLTRLTILAP
jgi:hypothetical protein